MSVKRYDIDAYSSFEAANWTLVESEVGDFVYASDYDELNAKYKRALFVLEYERENRMIERDAAKELREWVKKMIDAYRNAKNCSCPYCMKDFEAARKAVEGPGSRALWAWSNPCPRCSARGSTIEPQIEPRTK